MTCETETVPVYYYVRVTGNNQLFGPVRSFDAAEGLLNTVTLQGALEARIVKSTDGPETVTVLGA